MSDPSAMRIRSEGALEVLESAAHTFEQLLSGIQGPAWAEQLVNVDLALLEQATGLARKTVVQRLDHDSLGEGQQALNALTDARQRFRQAVLERAEQVGVSTGGKLNEVIARIRREFPILYETEVIDLGRPRRLGLSHLVKLWGKASVTLLVAQVLVVASLHLISDNTQVVRALVVAYATGGAALAIAGITSPTLRALLTRALRIPDTQGTPIKLTVGKRSFVYQGQVVPLSEVNEVELTLTEEGPARVTIGLPGPRTLRMLSQDGAALRQALGLKNNLQR